MANDRGQYTATALMLWSTSSYQALIAAAVAGLGLVIVVTGLGGLVLLYASGAVAVDAFGAGIGSRLVQTACDTLDRREELDAGDVLEPGSSALLKGFAARSV